MSARTMTHAALFAVLTLLGVFIRIPLGPVPFTLQTFFVLATGLLLLPQEAFFAMSLHLVLKWMLGGAAVLLSPSFGFVIGFIPAATLLSYLSQKHGMSWKRQSLDLIVSSLVFYLMGFIYMVLILRLYLGDTSSILKYLGSGVLMFLPLDGLKAFLAGIIARRLNYSSQKV